MLLGGWIIVCGAIVVAVWVWGNGRSTADLLRVFMEVNVFIGLTAGILVVIAEVVVVGVDLVVVIGRHVSNCRSLFRSTDCVISGILPGWFSRVDIDGGLNLR